MKFKLIPLILTAILPGAVVAQDTFGEDSDALVAAGKWSPRFTLSGFTGTDGFAPVVYDFGRGKDGEVLATGRFDWIGRRGVEPLVRLNGERWRPAKDQWSREAPEIGFSALATNSEGITALSTHSGPFGRVPAEIWLDTGAEIRVIGQLQGGVRSLVWFDGKLWAAGFFRIEPGGATNLAVWDGTSWTAPPGGPADRAVYRLSFSGESLLLAGDFTTVGGIPARGIAEWNGQQWKAYDLAPPINISHVYAVARTEAGELLAGGAITGGVLRWNGASWERLGGGVFDHEADGVVSDLVMHKGELYITGCFSHLNGPASNTSAVPAQSVAKWTGSQWVSLDDGSKPVSSAWFEYGVCGSEPNEFTVWDMRYQRLFSDGERVLLGGTMAGVAGVPSQSVIAYDGEEWKAFGKTGDGLSGAASVVVSGGRDRSAYLLGSATHGGTVRGESGVFQYKRGWKALGGRLPEGLRCGDLAVDPSGAVFVGCNTISRQPGQPGQPVVLRLDGENWSSLALPGVEGIILDLRIDPTGRLWAAGGVRTGDATGSGFVVRLDGDRFTIVENGFNSMVFRLAFSSGPVTTGSQEFIAAGAFTQISGSNCPRIARWRAGTWEPLGTDLTTAVLALAWGTDAIYVSTETPIDPNTKRVLLGRWNGSQWIELATPENGFPPLRENTVPNFRDLVAIGRYLVAAGSVWPETGGRNVFVYDGSRLAPLAGGLNAIGVDSIAVARDGVWFGGEIAEAGSDEDTIPSIGIARFGLKEPRSEQ